MVGNGVKVTQMKADEGACAPSGLALVFSYGEGITNFKETFEKYDQNPLDPLGQNEGMAFSSRYSERPVPIRCCLPRRPGTGALLPMIPLLGVTSVRTSVFGNTEATVGLRSMYVAILSAHGAASEPLEWNQLARKIGHAYCREEDWNKLISDGYSSVRVGREFYAIWGPNVAKQPLYSRSLDPERVLEQGEFRWESNNWLESIYPPEPCVICIVSNTTSSVPSHSTLDPIIRSGSVIQPGSVKFSYNPSNDGNVTSPIAVIVLNSETPLPHPNAVDDAYRRLREVLQRDIDVITAHFYLLAAIDTVRTQLREDLNQIAENRTSPSMFHNGLREFWNYRLRSLSFLEHSWRLDEPGFIDENLANILDENLRLNARWESALIDIDRICQSANYFGEHPPSGLILSRPEGPPPLQVFGDVKKSVKKFQELAQESRRLQSEKRGRKESEANTSQPHQRRTIELHPFSNRETILSSISARLNASTLLTATSGLLLGLLLSGNWSTSHSAPPYEILLLFLSTFAFFFETLLLAHASRQMIYTTINVSARTEQANAVSLFLGQFPFLVALPLSIVQALYPPVDNGASGSLDGDELFLAIVVSLLGVTMAAVYLEVSQSGKFQINSYISRRGSRLGAHIFSDKERRLLVGCLHVCSAILFFDRIHNGALEWGSWIVISLMIGLLLMMTWLSWLVAGLEQFRHYEVDGWDQMGEESAGFNDPNWE